MKDAGESRNVSASLLNQLLLRSLSMLVICGLQYRLIDDRVILIGLVLLQYVAPSITLFLVGLHWYRSYNTNRFNLLGVKIETIGGGD